MRISTFHQFEKQSDMINQQYDAMNRLFNQASSGKKIQNSSEDPVLATQIKSTQNYIDSIAGYYNNGVLAQNRSRLFSTSVQNSLNVLNDVQTTIIKVQGGTLSDGDRSALAKQLQGDLTTLLNYANTHDGDGNYIYAGYNTNSTPYVQVNGSYQYQGGLNQAMIDIGSDVSTLYYESGFNVFGDIYQGNGSFTVSATSSNTGSASTTPGAVINPASYVPDDYTISFAQNTSGELVYSVTGAASGQVIPPLPATIPDDAPLYQAKSDITFNGLSLNIDGVPNPGDSFVVQPSTQENVFNTLQNLINMLQNPVTDKAQYDQELSQISASFTQISLHMTTYLSQVGTQSMTIDNQVKNNDDVIKSSTIALSGLQDADFVGVISAIAQKSMALQASYQSYAQLQQTLMQILKL